MKKFKWPWQAQEEREAERKALRRFEVPDDKLEELAVLVDAYHKDPKDANHASRLKIWRFIATFIPEVKELTKGGWHGKYFDHFHVEIREGDRSDWEN